MRVLYAIQGTGNGHLSRAKEILPLLAQYAEVDVLISGAHAELKLLQPIIYRFHGLGFLFGAHGGIDVIGSMRQLRLCRAVKDIYHLPIADYELVLNDFEPISAYAAKLKGVPIHAISHQAAFISPKCPRPVHKNAFAEWLFKNYAPAQQHTAFHFARYDDFIHTPVIRAQVRQLTPTMKDHVTVYLPSYAPKMLIPILQKRREIKWHFFSKMKVPEGWHGNVWLRNIDDQHFLDSLASSAACLTGAGFESPAEALYLGKKLMVIPMSNQYEQWCNAAALKELGVYVAEQVSPRFDQVLQNWLQTKLPLHHCFPDETEKVVQCLLKSYGMK